MRIQPRLDYVILQIEVASKEAKTDSGIFLPKKDSNSERQQFGIIKGVGEGRLLDSGIVMPLKLKVEQKVMFNKYAGTEIKVGDGEEQYILIHERDIIAIVD
jgi:chaperonin GroES